MRMGPPPKTGNLVVRGKSVVSTGRRPSTTTIRRSGSIGNLPKAVIPAQQRSTDPCHCSQPVKEEPKGQYTKSLEQQVQLLELENLFLKRESENAQRDEIGTIMARGNEVSLNGRDWCRLPDFHPNLEKVIHERMARSDQGVTRRGTESNVVPAGTQQVIEKLREIKSSARDSGRSSQVFIPVDRSVDTSLLHQLEEKNQEVGILSERLKEQMKISKQNEDKVNQLQLRLREAESDLSSRSEADTRDKRAMIEEMLELQRRLDDLTPILAEKESRISRIENERDALIAKLRTANNEIATIKLQLAETRQEEKLWEERETSVKLESQRIRETAEESRLKLVEKAKRLEEAVVEIQMLQRQLKEDQLRRSNDNRLMQQVSEENSRLISENSRITAEIAKVEYELAKWKEESARSRRSAPDEEQLIELRLNVKAHLTTIGILEERLKAAQSRSEALETELAGRWEAEESVQNEKTRTQKELEALEALSKSLSNENKTLREEKILLQDRVDGLKRKINARDFQLRNLEEEMSDMERKHVDNVKRAEEGSRANSQRALELEELSRRIRELSDSLPSESRRSASQTSSIQISEHRVEQREHIIQPPVIPPFRTSGHPPTIPEEPEFSCGSIERFLRS